jgi:hypothetical protein
MNTRESLLHLVERSITAEKLVTELERVFAARGAPKVLRCDNGPELISAALQRSCTDRVGISYIPPGTPWNNGYIESFNRRLRTECLNRNHWTSLLEARVVIGDFKPTTTCGTGIQRWGIGHRPSTQRPAPTPTIRLNVGSTENGRNNPGSTTRWSHYRTGHTHR